MYKTKTQALCKEQGRSIKWLARQAGVTVQQLYNYWKKDEKKTPVRYDVLLNICNALDCELDDIHEDYIKPEGTVKTSEQTS